MATPNSTPVPKGAAHDATVAARPRPRDRIPSADDAATDASAATAPERWVAGFRLVRLLGEGGMGSVFLAEQHEPVRRDVALKLVRSSIEAPAASARFAAERQALARLSHPNVAAMYEAGTTAEGFPFFVMELIDGVPVNEFCDRQRLTIRQRLELFIDICRGVQHAHQKGLIHRDLKPSNVLVMEVEGRAVPKVIDFGIAKAIDQPLTESRAKTRGVIVGTPGYISPEVLSGDDIDTRADVYSLGVLLYELLAGVRPYSDAEASVATMIRRTTDGETPAPRALFRALEGPKQAAIADARRETVLSLMKLLSGDLASIAMTAIARERDARYPSAGELASDVSRFLHDEPVTATPPSFAYLAGKFTRRHRAAVLASAAALVAIIAGAAATTVAMIRAERARAEASAISKFLLDVIGAASPWQRRSDITVRELLTEAASRIPADLKYQPAAQARLLTAIGSSQFHLARLEEAERNMREALRIRLVIDGEDSPLVARLQNDLGMVLKHRGDHQGAERLLRDSLRIREKAYGRIHGSVARGLFDLGSILEEQGNVSEAEAAIRESLALRELLLARGDPDVESRQVALTWAGLGGLLARKGDLVEAERVFRRSLDIRGDDRGYAWARTTLELADVLSLRGRPAEAEATARPAIAVLERFLEPDDPRIGEAFNALADALRLQNKTDFADELFQRVIRQSAIHGESQVLARALRGIADLRREEGRHAEAEEHYRRALAEFPTRRGYWDIARRQTVAEYAAMLRQTGRAEEAARVESGLVGR